MLADSTWIATLVWLKWIHRLREASDRNPFSKRATRIRPRLSRLPGICLYSIVREYLITNFVARARFPLRFQNKMKGSPADAHAKIQKKTPFRDQNPSITPVLSPCVSDRENAQKKGILISTIKQVSAIAVETAREAVKSSCATDQASGSTAATIRLWKRDKKGASSNNS